MTTPTPSSSVPSPGEPSGRGPAALQAPWRMEYLEQMDKQERTPAAPGGAARVGVAPGSTGSFLLEYWQHPALDERNHVIVRGREGMILLNAYPYANGHLLVALGEPRAALLDYDARQRAELWRLVDCACDVLTTTLEPQGVNIGINQGRAAGAGVPSHLHVHLVPRWGGDTNFMTVVGEVRVIPASLDAMWKRYRSAWERCRSRWTDLL